MCPPGGGMRGLVAASGAVFGSAALLLTVSLGVVVLPPHAKAAVGDAVPAEYRALIHAPGPDCPGITAPLLAAQLNAESDFNPRAVSSVGAMGLAQFMPGTWRELGRDADGDGRSSAFDPADAIDAQSRYMCDLYKQAEASNIPDNPVELA